MYEKGKIYKIISDTTDKIYIGSTCQPLSKRHHRHKMNFNSFINGKRRYSTSVEIIKLGNTNIILLENFPCNSKEELFSRERYYIEINKDKVVNKIIPTRTTKEYYDEVQKGRAKEKYDINKSTILAKQKQYYNSNKSIILSKQKEIYQATKEYIICECNQKVLKQSLNKHYKSKKHIKNLQTKQ